jgi:predicted CoA-binding protein
MKEKVAILGASHNPERYAHKAFKLLQQYGHEPVPVNPAQSEIEGKKVYPTLGAIDFPVDTLTMYVGPAISSKLEQDILALQPKRVIFNPGSENPDLEKKLQQKGVQVVEACTLVMLRTNQFEG